MKHSFKKLTAWLCCMAMLISFVPATALPVFAAEADVEYVEVAGGALTNTQFYTNKAIKLTAPATVDANVLLITPGEYYLDLAGQAVTLSGDFYFDVRSGVTLTIKDSLGGGTITGVRTATLGNGMIFVRADATVNLAGGKLTGRTTTSNCAGAVRVYGGTFNMTGGEISDNTAGTYGGAIASIQAGSVINISGGTITNNHAATTNNGGAIYVKNGATVTISGSAKITNNTAKEGGAISANSASDVVNIQGGEISGNEATTNGGAIATRSGVTVNISGGTITNNEAIEGGGIWSYGSGTWSESAHDTVTISGDAAITGNIAVGTTGRGANICAYGATYNISGGTIDKGYWDNGTTTAAAGNNFRANQFRGGAKAEISGGEIAVLEGGVSATQYMGSITITGNPVIGYLSVNPEYGTTATIGPLTRDASITTSAADALTLADNANDTVAHDAGSKLYTYNEPTWTVTTGEVTNGTVEVAPAQGVYGTEVEVTATPDDGYELVAIFVDGVQVSETSPATFTIKDGADKNVVTATFEAAAPEVLELPTSGTVKAGTYNLTAGVTLEDDLKVLADTEVIIDLQGQTVTVSDDYKFNVSGTLTIKDSVGTGIITGTTTATSNDGMIYIGATGTVNLTGGTLTGRTTTGNTGAVRVDGGTFNMTGGSIAGNTTSKSGGAIYSSASGSEINVSGGTISGNTATQYGGGIYVTGGATVTIEGSASITGNTAAEGGGIAAYSASDTVEIKGGSITGNITTTRAANIYAVGATYEISGGTIDKGFYNGAAAATLRANQFRNSAVAIISGGNIAVLDGANNGGLSSITITGNPVIGYLSVVAGTTTTSIGGLTSGASITTSAADALTIDDGDETVVHEAGSTLYTSAADVEATIYNVVAGACEYGTVSVDPATAKAGDTVTVTTDPDDYYKAVAVTVTYEGGSLTATKTAENTYTFAMPAADATVTATFEAVPTYGITVEETVNGTVTAKATAAEGETVTLTVDPATGYELDTITVTGASGSVEVSESNTFTMPAEPVTVTATFKKAEIKYVEVAGGALTNTQFYTNKAIKLTAAATVDASVLLITAGEYYLDLNGQTVTVSGDYYFDVRDGVTLTILDSSTEQTGTITGVSTATAALGMVYIRSGGTVNLTGGTLTGRTTSNHAGAVNVAGGTFNMTGGAISEVHAKSGGAIYSVTADSTINIEGGTISGNTATVSGGAIFANASGIEINVSGGTISGNTATSYGGGIYVNGGATVTIEGDAKITGNTAKEGGGISANNASDKVYIKGDCSITGNITTTRGANIYAYAATYEISGGTIDAGIYNAAAAAGANSNQFRNGAKAIISGGNIAVLEGAAASSQYVAEITITGNPEIGYLSVNPEYGTTAKIGPLTSGASVTTSLADALTIVGDTVVHEEGSKLYTSIEDYVEPSAYDIIITAPVNGEVTADKETATAGETVTLTVTPATDYEVASITVTGTSGTPVDVSNNTFEMPAEAVTVTVTFAVIELDFTELALDFSTSKTTIALTAHSNLPEAVVLTLPEGKTSITYTLNLGSYTLKGVEAPYITVEAGVTLTITGTGTVRGLANASAPLFKVNGGALVLNGPTITGHTNNNTDTTDIGNGKGADMGTINIGDVATSAVTIKGNTTITNNTAYRGGAIAFEDGAKNFATLTISGGTIIGNYCKNTAAALYANGAANIVMTGGTIKDNYKSDGSKATSNGNVWLRSNFDMGGGEIDSMYYLSNDYRMAVAGTAKIGELCRAEGTMLVIGNLAPTASILWKQQISNNTTASAAVTVEPVLNDHTVAEASRTTESATLKTSAEDAGTPVTLNFITYTGKSTDLSVNSFVDGGDGKLTLQLTEDSVLPYGGITLSAGDYVLDLNGNTLTGSSVPFFKVPTGATLTIKDSGENGTLRGVHTFAAAANAMVYVDGGTFVLESGTLTGNTSSGYGGAIYVPTAGSVVTVTGGEITGNTAYRGGAISTKDTATAVAVTINIQGGELVGNVATNNAATMYTQTGAELNISGGKLGYGQKCANGVYSDATSSGDMWIRSTTVTITGGEMDDFYFHESGSYVATINGNPVIGSVELGGLVGPGTATAAGVVIAGLSSGAKIFVRRVVTVDEDVNALVTKLNSTGTQNLYRYRDDVKRILIVGNSFAGDSLYHTTDVAAHFGKEVETAYLYIGSQTVRQHAWSLAETLRDVDLNGTGVTGAVRDGNTLYSYRKGNLKVYDGDDGYNDTIATAMNDGTWDVVVLQPGVEYVGFEGTYNSDIDFLMDYIQEEQPNAEIYWNQTWAVDQLDYDTETEAWANESGYLTQFGGTQQAMYDAILRNTEKFIVGEGARFQVGEGTEADDNYFDGWFPMAIAIQTMRNAYTDTTSLDSYVATRLTRDGYHLSGNAGRLIAAFTMVKTLYGNDIDLSTLTVDDLSSLLKDQYGSDYRADAFEVNAENLADLITAVNTAYECVTSGELPTYGNGTANKSFNPDAAILNDSEFVVTYEGVTEVGQQSEDDKFASAGAGKLVITNGTSEFVIDEQQLEAWGLVSLTDRYENLLSGNYYIMADPQNPELTVMGNTLVLTFDVKLYTDDGQIHSAVYLTTSTDGAEWTTPVNLADKGISHQIYGLVGIDASTLMLSAISVNETALIKLTWENNDWSVDTVATLNEVTEVAFAKGNSDVWALTSNGAMYSSINDWAAPLFTQAWGENTAVLTPSMVRMNANNIYVSWVQVTEAVDETTQYKYDIMGKLWSINTINDTVAYGWNDVEAEKLASGTTSQLYAGMSSGGQPSVVMPSRGQVKVLYSNLGAKAEAEDFVIMVRGATITLNSSLMVNIVVDKADTDRVDGIYARVTRNGQTTVIPSSEWEAYKSNDELAQPDRYKIHYSGIAAKEMGDVITVELCDDSGNLVGDVLHYSIQQYAVNRLNSADSSTYERTAWVNMLIYGAAAQENFSYNTENKVDSVLTAEQKQQYAKAYEATLNGFEQGWAKSASVVFTALIDINVFFGETLIPDGVDTTNLSAKVTYTNYEETEVSKDITTLEEVVVNGEKRYKVSITELPYADVSAKLDVTLCANGEELPDSTCTYSMETYAYRKQISTTASDADKNLAQGLMDFGSAAKEYFSNR